MNIKTNWEIGPSFVLLIGQILLSVFLGGGIYFTLKDGVESVKAANTKNEQNITRQSDLLSALTNKLIRVETIVERQDLSLIDVNKKLDRR